MQNERYPQIVGYIAKVAIPMKAPFVTGGAKTLEEGEKFFMTMRDCESNHDRQVEFDRARALMKWAYSCNGNLHGMRQHDGLMYTYVEFYSHHAFKEFMESLYINVDGATMK